LDEITLYVVEHTRWFHPSFEPDMKNRQVEYTGWFHLKVLNQTWRTDRLNIKGDYPVCSICQYFMSGSKRSDRITLYVQTCQYFMCGSKRLDGITLYVQPVSTSWVIPSIQNFETDMKNWSVEYTGWFHPKVLNQTLSTYKLNIQGGSIQKIWTRHKVLTSWTYKKFHSKFWTRHEVLTNKLGLNHPVCSICQYFISGSKLLDGITLYV
jgi:hypothetical protein